MEPVAHLGNGHTLLSQVTIGLPTGSSLVVEVISAPPSGYLYAQTIIDKDGQRGERTVYSGECNGKPVGSISCNGSPMLNCATGTLTCSPK